MGKLNNILIGTVVTLTLMSVPYNCASARNPSEKTFPTSPDDTAISDSASALIKSENTALTYSLLLTLVPTVTLVFAVPGLIVGPSTGYFYAGMPGRAWTGIGLRTAGIGGMISAFAICGWDCGPGDEAYNVAWVVFLSGAAITAGSAIYDIGTIKKAVRTKNESFMSTFDGIMPTYFADSKAFGLRMQFAF